MATVTDPLARIDEMAESALARIQHTADTNPLQGAVYGLGESVRMMSVIVTELSAGLTPDERGVVHEALDTVSQVIGAVEQAAQNS